MGEVTVTLSCASSPGFNSKNIHLLSLGFYSHWMLSKQEMPIKMVQRIFEQASEWSTL